MRIGFNPIDVDSFVPTQQFQELLDYCAEKEDSKFEKTILISTFPIPYTFIMYRVGDKYKIEFFEFLHAIEFGYEDREIDWFDFGDEFNVWKIRDCYFVKVSSNTDRLE